ncbi:MAG TPA: class I SAM-dependent methyltransferase, partial [Chloroflexota bacterium]|nr:class I SAM-dependent methyltransferase [Chloroflexota bacterium]
MDETSDLQASYDRVATRYAEDFFDELSRKPFDRRLLDQFAEQVRGQGPVWDVGCGPGHVARYLHGRGLPVSGLDLSAGMIACARRLNPDISFAQGTMLALP